MQRIYKKVFGHEIGGEGFSFLKKLSWSFTGIISSAAILFVVGISAGRLLGPDEFGKYNLAISVATIVAAIVTLGFDQASVRYISVAEREEEKRAHYSNTLWVLIVNFTVLSLAWALAGSYFGGLINMPKEIVAFALAYAAVLSVRQASDSYIRGLGLFKQQAIVKIIESVVTLVLFGFFFIFLHKADYRSYLTVLSLSGIVTVLIYCVRIFGNPIRKWNRAAYVQAKAYAFNSIFTSSIGIFVLNIDRFFLNHSMGTGEVGIFSAYTLVPSMMVNYFSTGIINVFFPVANRLENKRMLVAQLNRLALWGFIPVVASIALAGYAVIILFGKAYPIIPLYLIEIAVFGFFQLYLSLFAAVVGSSEKMYRYYARLLPVKLIGITGMYLVLQWLQIVSIPYLLAMMSLVAIFDVSLFVLAYKKNIHEHSSQ